MMSKKYLKKNDDAISPVIGVMLMLVVTIIIAAVVAAFATGLTTDAEASPNAVLDVSLDSLWGNPNRHCYPMFSIDYLSGDTELDTSKMSIDFTWKCPACGNVETNHYVPDTEDDSTCVPGCALVYPSATPFWTESPEYYAGNYIFKPGQTMITPTIDCQCTYGSSPESLIADNCCMKKLLGDIGYYIVEGYCSNNDCDGHYSEIVGEELGVIIRYDGHIIYDEVVVIE